jgi:hypothetical protein
MLTGRTKPIRIVWDPDNQLPDERSSTVTVCGYPDFSHYCWTQTVTIFLERSAFFFRCFFKYHCYIILQVLLFFNVYLVVFLFNSVIYVFLLLCLIVCLCIYCMLMYLLYVYVSSSCQLALFGYPDWLKFFCAFSSVVRQMPGNNSQIWGTARTLPNFLCCSMYCLFCVVLCIVCFVSFCVLFVLCRSMYCWFCVVLCIVCFVSFCVLFVLCRSVYCLFCVVLCIVCFVSFCVLFVRKCVLYCCHRVAIQLQLTNISYHNISYHISYCNEC